MKKITHEQILEKARENGEKNGKLAELDFGAGAEWMQDELLKANRFDALVRRGDLKPCWVAVKDRLPTKDDADDYNNVLIYRIVNEGQESMAKSIYKWNMVKLLDEGWWMPLPSNPTA